MIKAWAGMSRGKIHITKEKYSDYPILAIFNRKHIAKLAYEHVEPVWITLDQIKGDE